MSYPLFKATLKSNWLILLIFLAVFLMYISSFIGMYDPASPEKMKEVMKLIPAELASAMGMGDVPADLTGFLGSYLYGMLVFIIPLIYVSIMGNRLLSRLVDNGSMAYLLSTPNTRTRIAWTQGFYFIMSVAAMFICLTGITVCISQAAYPNMLNIAAFIRLNFCAFLLTCAVSSICWFFSCFFNETKYSLAFGVGIPVLLYMLHVIGGIKEEFGWIGSLSVYKLFKASEILSGSADVLGICAIFAVIALVLYSGGVLIFSRKNLPL